MFDLRYHVASLAAVFLALIVGIVVGVGLTDRGVVDPERDALNARIADLERRLDVATQRATELSYEQRAGAAFMKEAYAEVVRDRLDGKRIAVVFAGATRDRLRASIERALRDGGEPLVRLRALETPLDVRRIDRVLSRRPELAPYSGPAQVEDLGRELGRELVEGEETPFWDAVSDALVDEREGGSDRPADGVVVARGDGANVGATPRFLEGLYAGLRSAGVPAVGVDTADADGRAIQAFRKAGLSTVDALDTTGGRLSLILLLAGGEPGSYGVKRTAEDGVLPPLDSVPAATTPGG